MTAISVKPKVTANGAVRVSPWSRPMIVVMTGDRYMQMPDTVMGEPFNPAVKNSMGVAVTMPVAGRSKYCQPWRMPIAPVLFHSLRAM